MMVATESKFRDCEGDAICPKEEWLDTTISRGAINASSNGFYVCLLQ